MSPADRAKVILAAGKIGRIAVDLVIGDREDATQAALDILGLLTDLIPVDDLKPFLTDAQRRIIDLENDVVEQLKLAGEKP